MGGHTEHSITASGSWTTWKYDRTTHSPGHLHVEWVADWGSDCINCIIDTKKTLFDSRRWKSWKLMVLSGFKGLPYPSLCQKRCVSCFCFPRKKTFFYDFFSHFALLYGYVRVEPDHENHKFHEKSWISLIFIDFCQKSWNLMVFDAPGRLSHPVLGLKYFS